MQCFHLLRRAAAAEADLAVDLVDAKGVGAGASGAAAGLLHPLAPRGDRLLWRGREGVEATLRTLEAAEAFAAAPLARRFGVVKPAGGGPGQVRWREAAAAGTLPAEAVPLGRLEAVQLLGAAWRPPEGLPADGAVGLHVAGGATVKTEAYLEALWGCAEALAAEHGLRARLRLAQVTSLAELRAEGYDHVVLATGAATQALPEMARLHLELCTGHVLEMASPDMAARYPPGAPSVLGPCYVAPQGDGATVMVGATKDWGVCEPEEAMDAGMEVDEAAAAAATAELLGKAERLGADLSKWEVARVRAGVRASGPGGGGRRLPCVGAVPGLPWATLLVG